MVSDIPPITDRVSRHLPRESLLNRPLDPQFFTCIGIILLTFVLDIFVIVILVKYELSKEAWALLGTILGAWHLGFAGAYGFEIGSSYGSKQKSEQLALQVKP